MTHSIGDIMEFQTGKPPQTAMYLVDRGMQGKYYRWYDAETDSWSMCGSDMTEALSFVGRPSPVGFFPWVGPMTGPRFNPSTGVADPEVKTPKVAKAKPASRKMARQRTVTTTKLVISKVGNTTVGSIVKGTKTTYPDGTVFFRADRQKWVAMMNGKQEAARPTPEACLSFLKKKYNVDGIVLK
jgi:hypothetical protein